MTLKRELNDNRLGCRWATSASARRKQAGPGDTGGLGELGMNAELGTPVSTSDGRGIGTIDALIVERTTRRVRAVVIREGFLMHRRVRVPVTGLFVGAEEDLRCDISASHLASLPPFRAREVSGDLLTVQGSPSTPVSRSITATAEAAGWEEGRCAPRTEEMAGMVQQTDRENAVVEPGAPVVDEDGSRLGRVERITFDLRTGELGSVTFRGGFLGTAELAIPAAHVVVVDDDRVMLDVTRDQIDRTSVSPY